MFSLPFVNLPAIPLDSFAIPVIGAVLVWLLVAMLVGSSLALLRVRSLRDRPRSEHDAFLDADGVHPEAA
jgi:hypothetical protein